MLTVPVQIQLVSSHSLRKNGRSWLNDWLLEDLPHFDVHSSSEPDGSIHQLGLPPIDPKKRPPAGGAASPASPPGGRTQLYFRPVSTTLRCVMILTIQSLLIYTGLSLSRNADELAARSKPSHFTDTFAAASRTSVFPSMLCMLFVGCRMYVLAATEGLGEPPKWVKFSMWVATAGMTLQFVIIFMLPFVIKASPDEEEDGANVSDLAGGQNDVHPILHPQRYQDPASGEFLRTVQSVVVFLVYAGAFGVLAGVVTYEPPKSQISFAVVCMCILSLLYFLVYFILWRVRNHAENKIENAEKILAESESPMLREELTLVSKIKSETAAAVEEEQKNQEAILVTPKGEFDPEITEAVGSQTDDRRISNTTRRLANKRAELKQRFEEHHAQLSGMVKKRRKLAMDYRATVLTKTDLACKGMAMNMSMSARKAPMMAVLFLAARMRALQLNPPHGMPPGWAQSCFLCMTIALFLEIVIAGYIGYHGKEEQRYYGLYMYHANPLAHIAHHTCQFAIYACLVPVTISIFLMKYPGSDRPAPLSPAVTCVMWFELMYFGVLIVQWAIMFAEDVLMLTFTGIKKLHDTCLAAGVSLTFAPLLCVLFVACRMRALQITRQEGSVPEWAQDCMFMCVFATAVQVVCCLMMPMFTEGATVVDEEGNTTYDRQPMIGAYFVTVIKYVALMMLHGGVIIVCVAIFVMTPEMCLHPGTGYATGHIGRLLMLICLIMIVAVLLSSAKVVGLAFKFAIESCADTVVGAHITVKKSTLSVFEGYVNVQGLLIGNPPVVEGGTTIDPPWSSECLMKAKTLIIKINMWRLCTSFGKEVELEEIKLNGLQVNFEKWSLSRESNVNMVLANMKAKGHSTPGDEQRSDGHIYSHREIKPVDHVVHEPIDISVFKVNLSGIQAHGYFGGVPMPAKVPDIKYENFTEENGGTSLPTSAIVSIILRSILYSVVSNLTDLSGAVSAAVGSVGGAIYGLLTELSRTV